MDDRPEVIKRLAKSDEERKEQLRRKRLEQQDERNPNESTERFLEEFGEEIGAAR